MDRGEIEEEFHSILDSVADGIEKKLDIAEAVRKRSSSRTAGRIASESSTLRRKVVRPVIRKHRRDMKKQFSRIVDAVENEEEVEEIEDELFRHDIFYQNLKGESDELEEKIIERFEHLYGVLQRLYESEEEDVWSGVRDDFSEEEAREFIDQVFGFTEKLDEHREKLEYREEVSLSDAGFFLPLSFEIDYTPEAIQVMKESEEEVREKLERKLDRLYGNQHKDV